MLRLNPYLKRFTNRAVLHKRLYQTTQQQVTTTIKPNYAVFTAATLIAAGAGYWYGSNNKQQQATATTEANNASQFRPQVPVPAIPAHETITKAFDELRKVLPAEHVSVDEEALQDHGYSNNSYHNEGAPNIVVYPSNTNEVAAIVKIANKFDMPIIPFSGGTSLEGHFSAPKGGICISFTEHMDQIVEFHPQDMDIVVQPGIQWEDLNFYLKKHGLFFPMDPGPG